MKSLCTHWRKVKNSTSYAKSLNVISYHLRWLNTVYARFTDSLSDAIKRALGLWYANTAVDKVKF